MDIKDLRKIIELMKQNDLAEFELEEEGFRIAVKRRGHESQVVVGPPPAHPHPHVHPTPAAAPAGAAAARPAAEPEGTGEEGLVAIKSPMVGTFYRSSAPDAEPFITVGSEVDEDTLVCIIEAMKVMNEIKAEVGGIVRKVLVDSASTVQFGQPLFLVEPA